MTGGERNTVVPPEYVGLFQQAVLAEIDSSAKWVRQQQRELVDPGDWVRAQRNEPVEPPERVDRSLVDLMGARRSLEHDFGLLDRVLGAPAGEPLAVTADDDDYTVLHALQAMVSEVLTPRLTEVCKYGPLDAGEVRRLAEALHWASESIMHLRTQAAR